MLVALWGIYALAVALMTLTFVMNVLELDIVGFFIFASLLSLMWYVVLLPVI